MSFGNITKAVPASWAASQREDLNMAAKMLEAGYCIEYAGSDTANKRFELPHDSVSFKKDDRVVWRSSGHWRSAKLVDGSYQYHRTFATLLDYLYTLETCIFREDIQGEVPEFAEFAKLNPTGEFIEKFYRIGAYVIPQYYGEQGGWHGSQSFGKYQLTRENGFLRII